MWGEGGEEDARVVGCGDVSVGGDVGVEGCGMCVEEGVGEGVSVYVGGDGGECCTWSSDDMYHKITIFLEH